jgi:Right handed beta helix region
MSKLKHLSLLSLLFFFLITTIAFGQTLHVGAGYPFPTLTDATDIAVPGDTILVHEGIYSGGLFVGDLQGTASDWIYILAAQGEEVIFNGGSNAWQFTDGAYLHIQGFIFEHQTGNGLNFDDGGTYDSPAHHIIFEDCTFREMDATGNNDLLKLSGLDSFEIRNCLFLNGSYGGSGIDMVGCHDGIIHNNHFENQGSNGIQAKGGTRNIRIEANFFKHCGQRSVNLGGSTGLQFFRPIDAPYEAADLKVYSNIFIGSVAPIAFVGCINTEVINNTIYRPEKWALRILQETVDETRFPPCGNNTFRNNILFLDERVSVECNIGPNTAPETFTFSNNLWYQTDEANWTGPVLPVVDTDNIVAEDPLFEDAAADNFLLEDDSPAIGQGFSVADPALDYTGNAFIQPRSIGSIEGGEVTGVEELPEDAVHPFSVQPNPARDYFSINFKAALTDELTIRIIDANGIEIQNQKLEPGGLSYLIKLPSTICSGSYRICLGKDPCFKQLIVLN